MIQVSHEDTGHGTVSFTTFPALTDRTSQAREKGVHGRGKRLSPWPWLCHLCVCSCAPLFRLLGDAMVD